MFLKNPPILILDEATSALDNESEILVGQSLEKLAHGRTTLTIAHRLTTIKDYDRILVLGEEGIVESGTHDQLLAKAGRLLPPVEPKMEKDQHKKHQKTGREGKSWEFFHNEQNGGVGVGGVCGGRREARGKNR